MNAVSAGRFLAILFWTSTGAPMIAALPDAWNVRASATSNQLNSVAYGNGLFVAVGAGTTILTSPEGINWTARSTGMTSPTLSSAGYANGRYVVGGAEAALIRSSTNGIDWAQGLSTVGIEHINGITYGYGLFVAVGSGPQLSTGYILTSSNGLDWISQNVPTTNALFGVSPAFALTTGWADNLFVAVGDHGTILTSTNGINWTLRDSGTAVPLRSVVWHGRLLVGGDAGTILTSSDGISWGVAAPTSFNVRGLATSGLGGALVAVGNSSSLGRLQASTDGMSWPGLADEFSQPLNGVAYGGGSFVAVGNSGLILQSIVSPLAVTNEWTKPASGSWEEQYWSLGMLPSIDQGTVAFRNPGWKALAIGSKTAASYPDSLSLNDLIVDGPSNSGNQLLLNWAGLGVPLIVRSNFTIGPCGSLASHSSALRGGNLYASGQANFSDSATAVFDRIFLGAAAAAELNVNDAAISSGLLVVGFGAPGTVNQSGGALQTAALEVHTNGVYNLDYGSTIATNIAMHAGSVWNVNEGSLITTDFEMVEPGSTLAVSGGSVNANFIRVRELTLGGGQLQADEMDFHFGHLTQTGGTNAVQTVLLPDSGDSSFSGSSGLYELSGGTLTSSNIIAGWGWQFSAPGQGTFQQSGGTHINLRTTLQGDLRPPGYDVPHGFYTLSGGLLASDEMNVLGGQFGQTGGTNCINNLTLQWGGTFSLGAGVLVTTNTTLNISGGVDEYFTQTGGVHTVQNRLLVDGMFVRYSLSGGTLAAANIEVGPNAQFRLLGGVISNSVQFTIRGGGTVLAGAVQNDQLGKLAINSDASVATLDVEPAFLYDAAGPTALRFQDSRDIGWSGILQLLHWSGSEHIFVGTNSQGLTSTQLNQVVFVNPTGWPVSPYGAPPSNYPAAILPTGELVPAQPPPLAGINTGNSLVLSWPGACELVTATNVAGPYEPISGATSPFTNTFTEPQRFFRLRLPGP